MREKRQGEKGQKGLQGQKGRGMALLGRFSWLGYSCARERLVASLVSLRSLKSLILAALALGAYSSAFAATGSSPEFKVDLRGLGPWQRRTAAASEALTYSSAWATNAASGAKLERVAITVEAK